MNSSVHFSMSVRVVLCEWLADIGLLDVVWCGDAMGAVRHFAAGEGCGCGDRGAMRALYAECSFQCVRDVLRQRT